MEAQATDLTACSTAPLTFPWRDSEMEGVEDAGKAGGSATVGDKE